jgi:CO/xanthine dehydrogenase Mo-binding subunit
VFAFGVSTAIHNALGKGFHGLPMSPPKALAVIEGER